MRKIIILIAFVAGQANVLSAQTSPQISTVWKFSAKNEKIGNAYLQVGKVAVLPDSSVVFETGKYDTLPSWYLANKAGRFISKISADGNLLIDRKQITLPGNAFLKGLTDFKVTPHGNIMVMATNYERDSTYLAQYDNNLTLNWEKIYSFGPSFEPVRATAFEILDNGRILLSFSQGSGRPLPNSRFGSVLTLNENGDSLHFFEVPGSISAIAKANDNKFFSDETLPFSDVNLFLRSSDNENDRINVTALIPADINVKSNFLFLNAHQKFAVITTDKNKETLNGPNDFALQLIDSLMRLTATISFNSIVTFKGTTIELINDQNKGLYVNQNLGRTFGSVTEPEYFALARLDSLGKIIWFYKIDTPTREVGGRIGTIMPLPGNEFVTTISNQNGVDILRIKADLNTLVSESVTTASSIKKRITYEKTGASADFSVTVAGNPSTDNFTLIVQGNNSQFLSLQVTDIAGRLIEKKERVSAAGTIRIGSNYKAGIYILSIKQGLQYRTFKLIKQ